MIAYQCVIFRSYCVTFKVILVLKALLSYASAKIAILRSCTFLSNLPVCGKITSGGYHKINANYTVYGTVSTVSFL